MEKNPERPIQSLIFLALPLLLLLALPALAQQDELNWYADFGGGPHFLSDTQIHDAGTSSAAESDTGYLVSGSVGRFFANFRAEGELFHFKDNFDNLKSSGLELPLDGDVSSVGGMANVYYDFTTGTGWKPYLGVGVGYMEASIDAASAGFLLVDDQDDALTYQFRAGVSFPYNSRTDLLIGYRFLGSEEFDFTDSGGSPITTDGIESHAIEGRVRFRF